MNLMAFPLASALMLAPVLLVSAALAQNPGPTPEQIAAKCAAEGGCATLTREQLLKALLEAHRMGFEAGYDTGERSCSKSI